MHKVGNYTLEGSIGQGGNGVVYRSTHPVLARPIAVKALHQKLAGNLELRERFLREARLTLDLNHPGIINVYDVDQDGERAFIAMELFEHGSLEDALAARQLPLPVALDVAAEIADALAYAHRQGVIHRDIKPSNVLLRADGTPVLADFGLALDRPAAATQAPAAQAHGTPAYMAPEQIRGLGSDGRTDIYALGVMLYQMVSGRLPFDGPVDLLIHGHLHAVAPRLRELDPAVPLELDALVGRMLAKDPSQRPSEMRQVAAQLRGIRAGMPATAPQPSTATRSALPPTTLQPPAQPPATDETIRLNAPPAAPASPQPQPIFKRLSTTSVPTAQPGTARRGFWGEAGMLLGLVGVCAAMGAIAMWATILRETPAVAQPSQPVLTPVAIELLAEPLLTDPQPVVAGQERWTVGSVNVLHQDQRIEVFGVARNDGQRPRSYGNVRVLLLDANGSEIYSAEDKLLGDYFEHGDYGVFNVLLTDYEVPLPSQGQYSVAFEIRSSPADGEYERRLRELPLVDTTFGRYNSGPLVWTTTISATDVGIQSASAYAVWFGNDGRVLGIEWANANGTDINTTDAGVTARLGSETSALAGEPASMAVLILAQPEREEQN